MFDDIDTWREFLPLVIAVATFSALVIGIIIDYAEECISHKPRDGGVWPR